MMRPFMSLLLGALLGATLWASEAAAEGLATDADGWHTWQVDEPGVSTEMCCFTWNRGNKSSKGCNLDARSISFSDSGNCAVAPGTIQIYVRVDDGAPRDIRVLSSNCPASTESEVADHGLVSAGESLDWFRSIIEDKQLDMDIREEALFGLVQSESDVAFNYLDRLLAEN